MRRHLRYLAEHSRKGLVMEKSLRDLPDEILQSAFLLRRQQLARDVGKPWADLDPVQDREKIQLSLTEQLPWVFALVREAARRTTGMRPYDVQTQAATALHLGTMVEMKTGEGKTLVAVLAACLNALVGKGVHVVTSNEYLAQRDAAEMAKIYEALGLTVGVTQSGQSREEKRAAYQADVTYGTHSEFGFDYLRDYIGASRPEDKVQRGFWFALVDEADSVLIDEARTPLILSGGSTVQPEVEALYRQMGQLVKQLEPGRDYTVDLAKRKHHLTDEGIERAEALLGQRFSDPGSMGLFVLQQTLQAQDFYEKNVDYLVKDSQVVIVDGFTGRLAEGRRWNEGLHMAIEAKEALAGEAVTLAGDADTHASITYQNYFRLYPKLAGMSGTAFTEAREFEEIYHLSTLVIPTHRPYRQVRLPDVFAQDRAEKFALVQAEVARVHATGQPVLVGTGSIEDSEYLSQRLTAAGIPHQVLNAKNHAREAGIIALAGRPGAVTLATNMAGRGTDIKLGGNPEALETTLKLQKKAWQEELDVLRADMRAWAAQARYLKESAALLQDQQTFLKDYREQVLSEVALAPDVLEGQAKAFYQECLQALAEDQKALAQQKAGIKQRHTALQTQKRGLEKAWQELEVVRQTMPQAQEKARALGGLYVIGTERFDARRIDNQLAGRCARQGDPGQVRFYLSADDPLLKAHYFQKERALLKHVLGPGGVQHALLSRQMNQVQKAQEQRNFETRKYFLRYDDVLDRFRREAYASRDKILQSQSSTDLRTHLVQRMEDAISQAVEGFSPFVAQIQSLTPEALQKLAPQALALTQGQPCAEADLPMAQALHLLFMLRQLTGLSEQELLKTYAAEAAGELEEPLTKVLSRRVVAEAMAGVNLLSPEAQLQACRPVLLGAMDQHWKTFLSASDSLRESIGWVSLAQQDPLHAYQKEMPLLYRRMQMEEAWSLIQHLQRLSGGIQESVRRLPLWELWYRASDLEREFPDLAKSWEIVHMAGVPPLTKQPQYQPVYLAYVEIAQRLKEKSRYFTLGSSVETLLLPRLFTDMRHLETDQTVSGGSAKPGGIVPKKPELS
jgi:preprotein translocase subunit SecA